MSSGKFRIRNRAKNYVAEQALETSIAKVLIERIAKYLHPTRNQPIDLLMSVVLSTIVYGLALFAALALVLYLVGVYNQLVFLTRECERSFALTLTLRSTN